MLYNIPLIQSLRMFEHAAALALLFSPSSFSELAKTLDLPLETGTGTATIPEAKTARGLRQFLTKE